MQSHELEPPAPMLPDAGPSPLSAALMDSCLTRTCLCVYRRRAISDPIEVRRRFSTEAFADLRTDWTPSPLGEDESARCASQPAPYPTL